MNRLPLSRGFAALLLAAGALGFSACSSSNDSNGADANSSGGEGGQAASDDTSDTTSTSDTETKSSFAEDCTVGGSIDGAVTIAPTSACPDGYRVKYSIYVSGIDAELTIAPGTVLTFDEGAKLSVSDSGTLKAIGTKEDPILFTGWQKAPGAWDSIEVTSQSMTSEIAYAIVEYAGSSDSDNWGAISLGDGETAAVLSLSNVELRKNGFFGLSLASYVKLLKFENSLISENVTGAMRARADSVGLLAGTGNRIENNGGDNTVRVTPQSISKETTWPSLGDIA